jgi:hypothetical protein
LPIITLLFENGFEVIKTENGRIRIPVLVIPVDQIYTIFSASNHKTYAIIYYYKNLTKDRAAQIIKYF